MSTTSFHITGITESENIIKYLTHLCGNNYRERERENEKRKTIPWNPSGIWIYLLLGSQVASLQEAWDFFRVIPKSSPFFDGCDCKTHPRSW